MIPAIETHYAGCRFRSRLEARWAVYFDVYEIKWEYEPEGYELPDGTLYLPDFWLPWTSEFREFADFPAAGCWVEVKPVDLSEEEARKCSLLAVGTGHDVFALAGPCDQREVHVTRWSYQNGQASSVNEDDAPLISILYHCSNNGIAPWDPGPFTAARSARFEHGETPTRRPPNGRR